MPPKKMPIYIADAFTSQPFGKVALIRHAVVFAVDGPLLSVH